MRGNPRPAKRGGELAMRIRQHQMSVPTDYQLPENGVGLTGPVERPVPGTLPLRGDLAHIALAGRYLAAHYVIPTHDEVRGGGAQLLLSPRDDASIVARLEGGTGIEVLDYAGDWAWIACGPEGPSGYVHRAELAGDDAA